MEKLNLLELLKVDKLIKELELDMYIFKINKVFYIFIFVIGMKQAIEKLNGTKLLGRDIRVKKAVEKERLEKKQKKL